MNNFISFNDWESGKVKIPLDEFFPIYGDLILGYTEKGAIYNIIGYQGKKTGIKLGIWFSEVME